MGKDDVIARELRYAMAQCSRREYSEWDILEKLRKRGVDQEDISKVLQDLIKNKFVDNLRYAKAFTRDKSILAGWGKRKIEYALRLKNIGRELIQEALCEADNSEAEKRMHQVLLNKWMGLSAENDDARALKLLRFGAGRGYSYEQINEILKDLKSKNKN